MTGRTHDAIAFASLLTVAVVSPPQSLNLATAAGAIVGNIVGATLPDLDQAGNKLWKFIPGGHHLGKILRRAFMGHRNLTHSIIGVFMIYHILLFLLNLFLNPSFVNIDIIFISMMIGYISHLVGDALTKEGLPLLFPLGWRFGFPPISAFRITAGNWIETLVILPGAGAYVFWLIGNRHEEFMSLLKLIVER